MSQLSWGSVEIRVTPQVLIQKAAEVNKQISSLTNALSNLEDLIQGSQSYWIGAAGDKFRQSYLSQKDEVNQMLVRLREHPKDLLLISGNYEKAEQTIIEDVAALKTDAIEW